MCYLQSLRWWLKLASIRKNFSWDGLKNYLWEAISTSTTLCGQTESRSDFQWYNLELCKKNGGHDLIVIRLFFYRQRHEHSEPARRCRRWCWPTNMRYGQRVLMVCKSNSGDDHNKEVQMTKHTRHIQACCEYKSSGSTVMCQWNQFKTLSDLTWRTQTIQTDIQLVVVLAYVCYIHFTWLYFDMHIGVFLHMPSSFATGLDCFQL